MQKLHHDQQRALSQAKMKLIAQEIKLQLTPLEDKQPYIPFKVHVQNSLKIFFRRFFD